MTDPAPAPPSSPLPVLAPGADALRKAAAALGAGRLVAFPTETVYGLGADAANPDAVAAIYAAKGRPPTNPLIVHVPDLAAAARLARVDDRAERLAALYWPGPLTLVLPLQSGAPLASAVTAGGGTVAVRAPAHPVARALLQAAGCPIAAPSANRSGRVSPTLPAHVLAEFPDGAGGLIACVLAAGRSPIGLESTVLDLSGESPRLLRPGAVTAEDLARVLGEAPDGPGSATGPGALPSPGLLPSHYAPSLPVRLTAGEAGADEAYLTFGADAFFPGGAERLNLSPSGNLEEAAANLFAYLRRLDQPGSFQAIAVMPIPEEGLGHAINDRLRRAAAPRPPGRPDP